MATQAAVSQVRKTWYNESFDMLVDDQLEAILEALSASPVMINDHGPGGREETVQGVALVKTWQGSFLCPIYRKEWSTLNQLYIGRDGRVHLSTRSVSGTLQGFPRHNEGFQLDTLESILAVARIGTDQILDVRWF